MAAIKNIEIYKLLFLVFIIPVSYFETTGKDNHFKYLREQMVKKQIQDRGITDEKVLKAMMNVERHKFVLPSYISKAYQDSPLPIEEGQTISQPYIVAYMTKALELNADDKVLEIGTGSGYQAAVLAEICDSVFTIEIFESLGSKARKVFDEIGYNNIYNKIGDGYNGWPEHAPFNAIIVTCSPQHIPKPLKEQLAEGGRMIIPVGRNPIQELVLLEKKRGKIKQQSVLPVRFVPMINTEGDKY